MIAVILGSLFLIASVTWLLWSAFSPYAVWQRKDILAELSKSQKVFSEKLDHLSRRLAWVHAAVYSQVSRVASARGCSLRQLTDWPLTGPGGAAPWCPLPSWASGTHLTLPAPQAPSHPVS